MGSFGLVELVVDAFRYTWHLKLNQGRLYSIEGISIKTERQHGHEDICHAKSTWMEIPSVRLDIVKLTQNKTKQKVLVSCYKAQKKKCVCVLLWPVPLCHSHLLNCIWGVGGLKRVQGRSGDGKQVILCFFFFFFFCRMETPWMTLDIVKLNNHSHICTATGWK